MQKLGFGVVAGNPSELYKFGLIHTPRTDQTFNDFLDEGIAHITSEFPRVLGLAEPDIIVSEMVPPGKLGSNSELVLASITVCKTIANQFGLPWYNIAAATWMSEVVGIRNSTKAKTRNAVFSYFPALADKHARIKKEQKAEGEKAEGLPADVTDAIAIALAGNKLYGQQATKQDEPVREREA